MRESQYSPVNDTHRMALADAEYIQRPLPYRWDLQGGADQLAADWDRARQNGGDTTAVLRSFRPDTAKAVYARRNTPLAAGCQSLDPVDPANHANGAAWAPGFKSITYGVYGIYDGTCGPSLTFVVVGTY